MPLRTRMLVLSAIWMIGLFAHEINRLSAHMFGICLSGNRVTVLMTLAQVSSLWIVQNYGRHRQWGSAVSMAIWIAMLLVIILPSLGFITTSGETRYWAPAVLVAIVAAKIVVFLWLYRATDYMYRKNIVVI